MNLLISILYKIIVKNTAHNINKRIKKNFLRLKYIYF